MNTRLYLTSGIAALLLATASACWSGYMSHKISAVKGFDEKVKEVEKLERRATVLRKSVDTLTSKRDQARSELLMTTAAVAAGKAYTEAEAAPASNISTQVIVLELHINK